MNEVQGLLFKRIGLHPVPVNRENLTGGLVNGYDIGKTDPRLFAVPCVLESEEVEVSMNFIKGIPVVMFVAGVLSLHLVVLFLYLGIVRSGIGEVDVTVEPGKLETLHLVLVLLHNVGVARA